ncbi:MAG TPA: hypothetical protein PLV92_26365, partial [Pirellulaceae bacterium]|nr:hypothetical protein [Pirellulaceae bacterium]
MFSILFLALVGLPAVESQPATPDAGPLPWVRVAEGGHGFDVGDKRFAPRGFNYDHDERGRL